MAAVMVLGLAASSAQAQPCGGKADEQDKVLPADGKAEGEGKAAQATHGEDKAKTGEQSKDPVNP